MFNRSLQLTRLPEWWQAKAGNLLGVLFLVMAYASIPFIDALLYLGPALLTILGIGGFGHLVNDWLDIEADQRAGKKNRMASLSLAQRMAMLIALLALALLPWLVLPNTVWSWYILATEFFLLIIYSMPPIRLKEAGIFGVLADALYAHALPSVLAAYTFLLIGGGAIDLRLLGLLAAWQLLVGVHNILIHQLADHDNDVASHTDTLATRSNRRQLATRMSYGLWPLECLAFIALVGYMSWSWVIWYASLPLTLLLLKYGRMFSLTSLEVFSRTYGASDRQLLNIHYHQFWPLWNLLCAMLLVDGLYLAFAILLLLLLPFYLHRLSGWSMLRNMGNKAIYRFRRQVLQQDVKTASREYYQEQLIEEQTKERRRAIKQKKQERVTLVQFARHQHKYTETFIRQHLEHMPFDVVPLYGHDSYWPIKKQSGQLLYEYQALSGASRWTQTILGLSHEEALTKAIQGFLVKEHATLALAEFGTVGATVLPVVRGIGLPLVVMFYGYDAFHGETLRDFRERYHDLFDYASALIGVSQDICRQLERLGAPSNKIQYLPCAVNLSLFQMTEHHHQPPNFLAIGRFAETKSPHLTILAFAQVAEQIPKAQLVMVGKDGGGELFDACHILVRALRLEDRITFKGILSPTEVYEEMKKARVFVQHSLTTPLQGDREGTPVAIMEALASGLAVVSTRHAGIAELITHEENGLLVEEYDLNAMAAAMLRLAQDDEAVARLGRQAAQSIRQNPLIAGHHQHLAEILQECI